MMFIPILKKVVVENLHGLIRWSLVLHVGRSVPTRLRLKATPACKGWSAPRPSIRFAPQITQDERRVSKDRPTLATIKISIRT